MGPDLGKALADAAKAVADTIVKAGDGIKKALDQNGDGKLDEKDIQTIQAREQARRAEMQRKADLQRLKPLFPGDFERAEFVMPKMIHVANIDKPHADNAVCCGSIGYKTVMDDMTVFTVYRDHIDELGLSYYPNLDYGVYYVDPCDRDRYILLDDYFSYMKMQRVAELQRIAQSLGAKHFKVTYLERSASVSSKSIAADASVKTIEGNAGVKANSTVKNSSLSTIRIEAELRFPGRAPKRPELRYLKKEINIINLIDMRMDVLSPLQHQRFNIEMSDSSGIRKKDAVKIDAMLKFMKITGNTTVEAEVQNEARRILEYEIEF